MKTIFILIISLAFTVKCEAQLIHIAESIKLELPASAYKINRQEMNAQKKVNSSYQLPEDLKAEYIYNVDGLILNLNKVSHDSTNVSLLGKKRFLDNLARLLKRNGNNTYTSVIRNFRSNQALITNKVIDHIGRYDFHLKNKDRTWTLWGSIEYPEADSAKATALLNDILNNAQFTQ